MLVADEERVSPSSSSVASVGDASGRLQRSTLDHRALLFGSRLGHGAEAERRGREVAQAKRMAAEERVLIEARNNELIDDLHEKVDELRSVALQVGHEASTSLSIVEDMDHSFDGALHVLRRTSERLQSFAKESGGSNLIRMTLFCVVFFLFLYFVFPLVMHGAKNVGGRLSSREFLSRATAQNSPASLHRPV